VQAGACACGKCGGGRFVIARVITSFAACCQLLVVAGCWLLLVAGWLSLLLSFAIVVVVGFTVIVGWLVTVIAGCWLVGYLVTLSVGLLVCCCCRLSLVGCWFAIVIMSVCHCWLLLGLVTVAWLVGWLLVGCQSGLPVVATRWLLLAAAYH
jgi:hypothetical protein